MVINKRPNIGKSGREEKRKILRTARRDRKSEIVVEKSAEVEESSASESEPETIHDKSRAYNALLTLLDTQENTKSKKINHQTVDETIEGLNLDSSDNEEEEAMDIESDEEGGDPYHIHFNEIPDDFVEQQDGRWITKTKSSQHGYTSIFQIPSKPIVTSESIKSLDQLHIKKRVLKTVTDNLTLQNTFLLNEMSQYKDVQYPYHNYKNQAYKKLYIIHAMNHIYKTRDYILKNNAKLSEHAEKCKLGKSLPDLEIRDQGFTRPKVLILLPTREMCFEVINLILQYSATDQQENKKRLTTLFHSTALPPETKPDDFRYYFKGNTNDYFTIGLKFTRKSVKLYSSFYSSDIIIASPIGLSMILENEDKRKREYDFLSSIEILVIDNANQIEMQNWDHVTKILKYLNKVPKESHNTDFSRVRLWSINDQAKYFTQRLVFSEFSTPIINSVINKSFNLAGKLKMKKIINSDNCIMNSVGLKVKQVFQRFESDSPIQDPDARFKFFINSVLNSLSNSTSYDDGLLIVIPSYFDYIRVKDYMSKETKLNFNAIDEYSSQSKLTRARQNFAQGKIKVLLYTERLHYFRRFEINGVKTVILYGVPNNPLFYKEYLKFIGRSVFQGVVDINLSFIKIIFSKWEAVALERIVGNERATILCNSVNQIYEFK